MKIRMPLISNPSAPMAGLGNAVETDARSVPRNTLNVLSHKPFSRPKPTTIHPFISM
jgi:hypothetical protein